MSLQKLPFMSFPRPLPVHPVSIPVAAFPFLKRHYFLSCVPDLAFRNVVLVFFELLSLPWLLLFTHLFVMALRGFHRLLRFRKRRVVRKPTHHRVLEQLLCHLVSVLLFLVDLRQRWTAGWTTL